MSSAAAAAPASAAPPAAAKQTPMQLRIAAVREAFGVGLKVEGEAKRLAALGVSVDMIIAIGLLLDRVPTSTNPLLLGEALPGLFEKKNYFGWSRTAEGDAFALKCLLCMLRATGGKVCITCSEVRNIPQLWNSHCHTHHDVLLGRKKEDAPAPSAPPARGSIMTLLKASADASAAASEVVRADKGRNMARYDMFMKAAARLAASGHLSYRTFEKKYFRDFVIDISGGRYQEKDIGGRNAMRAYINKTAVEDMATMTSELKSFLWLKDGHFLNGKPLRSLGAYTADGWSANMNAASMQTGTVFVFADGRLTSFCAGYELVDSKYPEETFRAQYGLLHKFDVPLGEYAGRTVDFGKDGMAKASLELWQEQYIKEHGRHKFFSLVCSAHGLDKAIYQSATGMDGFNAIIKDRSSAKAAGPGGAAAAAAAAAGNPDSDIEVLSTTPSKLLSLPIRMGAVAFSLLAGDLYGIVTAIRNLPSAHKKLMKKSGYAIPKMVITRWGVYLMLLGRAILVWPFIKSMDPVQELGLYPNAAAAETSWSARMLCVDNNMPAIALVLSAQRLVMVALEVLGTAKQPTAPLILPVMTWMIESVRLLAEAAFDKGAYFGQPLDFIENMKPVKDGKASVLKLSESESPMLLALRAIIGLLCAIYQRYPFEVIGGDTHRNKFAIRSKYALTNASKLKYKLLGQPLFSGRVRLLSETPFFNDALVLATLGHPRLSFAAVAADPPLFARGAAVATELFNAMYGKIEKIGGDGAFNPLAGFAAGAGSGGPSYETMLYDGLTTLHAAYLGDKEFSCGSGRLSMDEYKWLKSSPAARHSILYAIHRALYGLQGTSADTERTNSFGALVFNSTRRNLQADNGSSAVIVAMRARALAVQKEQQPTLADIPYLAEILHYLEAQLVDDKGEKLLPDLLAPPDRTASKTELAIREHTDALKLPGIATVMAALCFPFDGDESFEESEALSALDAGEFAADDDGFNIMPINLFSALQAEDPKDEEGEEDAIDFGVGLGAAEVLPEKVYGRDGNRSLRISLRAAAAEAAEKALSEAEMAVADAKLKAAAAVEAAAPAPAPAPPPASKRPRVPKPAAPKPAAKSAIVDVDGGDNGGDDDDGGDDE